MTSIQNNLDISKYLVTAAPRFKVHAPDPSLFTNCTTKQEVNKILFDLYNNRKVKKPAPAQLSALDSISISFPGVRNLDDRIHSLTRSVDDCLTQYNASLTELAEAYLLKEKLLTEAPRTMRSMVEDVTKTGHWHLKMVSGERKIIEFVSEPITLSWRDVPKAVDLTCPLGKFKVVFNCEGFSLRVMPYEDNIDLNGVRHPHVSSSGSVCWGNAAATYQKAAQDRDLPKIMATLWALLNEYNNESPYRNLTNFIRKQKEQEALKGFRSLGSRWFVVREVTGNDKDLADWIRLHRYDSIGLDGGRPVMCMRAWQKLDDGTFVLSMSDQTLARGEYKVVPCTELDLFSDKSDAVAHYNALKALNPIEELNLTNEEAEDDNEDTDTE